MTDPRPYRILMLHNRYQVRGGEEESTDAEVALLREHGHVVDLLELDNKGIETNADKVKAAVATTWSRKGAAIVAERLTSSAYDIVHCQNLFPSFSPAVYHAAARYKVPVVQAVRNYRLICASANLFRDGHYCNDCVGKALPLPALSHRCYRGSLPGTVALVAMQSVHRGIGTWSGKVARYVALTEYVRDRLVEGGFPASRIVVKPDFVGAIGGDGELAPELPVKGPYAVFVGRMTAEKGAAWLARTWAAGNFGLPLVFVGEGNALDGIAQGEGTGIHAIGKRSLARTYRIIAGAEMLIQSALWPEPFGRTPVEAYALGVPVVCARSGGLQELVRDGLTGFTYHPGDAESFAAAVRATLAPERRPELRAGARKEYLEKFTPNVNLRFLMNIYRDAITNAPAGH